MEDQRERIRLAVAKYAKTNQYLIPGEILLNEESLQHVVDIGTSIMCTKWDISPKGGGFVTAVCDNDLVGAICQADIICRGVLPFLVILHQNLGYVR